MQALGLYAAAQRLDPVTHPARYDETAASLIPAYSMLLGLAFENVLKGFISLVRLETGCTPPLPDKCFTHRLELLAVRDECTELAVTKDELKVLAQLSPYVEWAGCYPVPKRSHEMFVLALDVRDRDTLERLWNRVVPLLHDRAWIMKGGPESMGGHKLYFNKTPD